MQILHKTKHPKINLYSRHTTFVQHPQSQNQFVLWTCNFGINPKFQKLFGILDMQSLCKTQLPKINLYSGHANLVYTQNSKNNTVFWTCGFWITPKFQKQKHNTLVFCGDKITFSKIIWYVASINPHLHK